MRTFDAKDYNKEEMVDYIEQIIIAAIWTNKQLVNTLKAEHEQNRLASNSNKNETQIANPDIILTHFPHLPDC